MPVKQRDDPEDIVVRKEDEAKLIRLSDQFLETISTFKKYASYFLRIQTLDGTTRTLEFNEVQELLESIFKDIRQKGRLIRCVILKARREGVSTLISGRFFWKTTTNRNRYAMLVTHEPEATDFIFHMHKRFLAHLPHNLRPPERYSNKKMLEFNTDDGKGLDSAIRVGTAGKEDLGSGQLIHYLHLSELAKYPKHTSSNLLLSLLQCVPSTQDSEIFMESTAKGVGGEFYDRYWGSRYHYEIVLEDGQPVIKEKINEKAPPDNEYSSIFIPWFVFHAYERPVPAHFVKTDEEAELARLYGLTDEKLSWRRWCIENQCNGEVEKFNQEYPANPMEAFISSSDNVFDIKKLQARINVAVPPKVRYDAQLTTGNWLSSDKGKLMVWEEPTAAFRYVIAADPSEGIITGDSTCLDVICVNNGKQVATLHGRIPPDVLGHWAYWIGKRYNNALIAVERNNHGLTTIDKLFDLGYNNMYAEVVIEPPARPRKRYGWVTTKTSKPRLVDQLAQEFREGTDGIQCKELLEEMMFFKQHEDMTYGAEEGHHDDRVMSYAIARYVMSKLPMVKNRNMIAMKSASYYTQQQQRGPAITPASWT